MLDSPRWLTNVYVYSRIFYNFHGNRFRVENTHAEINSAVLSTFVLLLAISDM